MPFDPLLIIGYRPTCCPSRDPPAPWTLENQMLDVEYVEPNKSYLDLRSASRSLHHERRRRQPPTPRSKHCHTDCLAYEKRHLFSRRRRRRVFEEEGREEAYWDKECAELDHKEFLEFADPVRLYYDFGHNAAYMESLRFTTIVCVEPSATSPDTDVVGAADLCRPEEKTDENVNELRKVNLHSSSSSTSLFESVWTDTNIDVPQGNANKLLWAPYLLSGSGSRFGWSEFTMTWHRNACGVWELGYADQGVFDTECGRNDEDPYGCKQGPFTCMCCWHGRNFDCSCSHFEGLEDWDPEAQASSSLLSFLDFRTLETMKLADATFEFQQGYEAVLAVRESEKIKETFTNRGEEYEVMGLKEWTFTRTAARPLSPDWDVVSTLSSTGSWRVVGVGVERGWNH